MAFWSGMIMMVNALAVLLVPRLQPKGLEIYSMVYISRYIGTFHNRYLSRGHAPTLMKEVLLLSELRYIIRIHISALHMLDCQLKIFLVSYASISDIAGASPMGMRRIPIANIDIDIVPYFLQLIVACHIASPDILECLNLQYCTCGESGSRCNCR